MESQRERYIEEITELLEKCDINSLERIYELNEILVNLSAAKMEYLIELSKLLFCQSAE